MQEFDAGRWLGLSDKLCIVTGAGGGIGSAIASGFARLGCRVAALDRDPDALDRLVAEGIHSFVCDVASEAAVAETAAKVADTLGPAHILVNNAALLRFAPLAELPYRQWSETLAVNLDSYYLCARHFGLQMTTAGRGAMVHVASIAAHTPRDGGGAYSATKAAVAMLSQQLAVEFGPFGVRSNVVSPALVMTPMSAAFYEKDGVREQREQMIPLRRIGEIQEVVDAVTYLASDRASYVTGQSLLVDGGLERSLLSQMPG